MGQNHEVYLFYCVCVEHKMVMNVESSGFQHSERKCIASQNYPDGLKCSCCNATIANLNVFNWDFLITNRVSS